MGVDISFAAQRANYTRLWAGMKILPKWASALDKAVTKILAGKDRYLEIERATNVPWWFSGVIHMRESSCDFKTYLGNGQSLSRVTTIVPKGRGPFTGPNAFIDGAIDAYKIQKYIGLTDWSVERVLYLTEGYNGYGYMQRGKPSPYVWGYTNQCPRGKYIRDHVYDPNAEETQPGTAALLYRMAERDASFKLAA